VAGPRHDGRLRRDDRLGRDVGVTTTRRLSAGDLEGRDLRELRQAEALGDHGRDDTHAAVGRGETEHHDVGLADLLDGLGDDERRREGVGAGDGVVADVDALIGAHLQRLLDCFGCVGGADGQRRHLAAFGLDDLECFFDRVLVELRQEAVDVLAVGGVVLGEAALALGVGHVLDTDDDVHASTVLFRRSLSVRDYVTRR